MMNEVGTDPTTQDVYHQLCSPHPKQEPLLLQQPPLYTGTWYSYGDQNGTQLHYYLHALPRNQLLR